MDYTYIITAGVLALLIVGGAITLGVLDHKQKKTRLAITWDYIIHWKWAKWLLYWIVMSAGTVSELTFLTASVYMSLNSNVHTLMLRGMSEDFTVRLTEISTAAYIALPECILGLALVTTINHFKLWFHLGWKNQKNHTPAIWGAMFGLPTLVFIVLSVVTLGFAAANATFTMPMPFVIVRATAAYTYGIFAFLYWFLGQPAEADRLRKKDERITELDQQITDLTQDIEKKTNELTQELAKQKAEFEQQIALQKAQFELTIGGLNQELDQRTGEVNAARNAQRRLVEEMKQSSEDVLLAYGQELIDWINGPTKSATMQDIIRYTGLHFNKVNNAIKQNKFRKAPNSNPDNPLYILTSVVAWLRTLPPPARAESADTPAYLHAVGQ